MRISINARKIDGPYGGVNQFSNGLESYLTKGCSCVTGHCDPAKQDAFCPTPGNH